MKELTNKTQKGFTLVELMVVIAIIAILAAVGLAIYTGSQKTSRDAKRRADIDAMAAAYESNFNTTNPSKYAALADPQFASGKVPIDPGTTSYTNTLAAGNATYTVCAPMENNNGNSSTAGDGTTFTTASGAAATYYCKKNQQS